MDFSKIDIDDYLDQRDKAIFDSEWVKIEERLQEGIIPQVIREKSDEYREQIFLYIDVETGGSELADYVSDDLELLIFADYLKVSSTWFEKFVEAYEQGNLPV